MISVEEVKQIEEAEPELSKKIFDEYKMGKPLTTLAKDYNLSDYKMRQYSKQYKYTPRKKYYKAQENTSTPAQKKPKRNTNRRSKSSQHNYYEYTLKQEVQLHLLLTQSEQEAVEREAHLQNISNIEAYLIEKLQTIQDVQLNPHLQPNGRKPAQSILEKGNITTRDLTNYASVESRNRRNSLDPKQKKLSNSFFQSMS